MKSITLSFFAVIIIFITGCTENTMQLAPGLGFGSGAKTAAELKLEKDVKSLNQVSKNIIVRNTIQGAAVGAAVGCGFALILGGDSSDCIKAAVVGGVVGGVGGNQVGKKAAAANERIVNSKAIVANLKKVNGQLGSVQTNLRSVVRSQNAEIGSLRRQLAAKQITESAYKSRVNAINSNRANVSRGLGQAEQNMVNSQKKLVSLEKQSGQSLTGSKREVARTRNRLASLRKTISLNKIK